MVSEATISVENKRAVPNRNREIRLQIMLDDHELTAIEDWRFKKHMPSRAAAVREIIRRGLAAEGFKLANAGQKSSGYGIIETPESDEGTKKK